MRILDLFDNCVEVENTRTAALQQGKRKRGIRTDFPRLFVFYYVYLYREAF